MVTDNKGYITRVNKYFIDLLGYRKMKIRGKLPTEFYPKEPGSYQSVTGETVFLDEEFFSNGRKMFKQLMEQRHISNWESYLMGTDGRVIPVTQNCVLLYNKQQEMIGSVAIIRDDTEKKNTENQLRASHETLRALINAAPESLFLLDIDGTVIIANETLARRLGTDRSRSWPVQTFLTNISLMIWPHRAGCLPEQALRDREMVYYEDVRKDRYMANYVYPLP